MLSALVIEDYRAVQSLVMLLTQLNVISGANGSRKSDLYRALRLPQIGTRPPVFANDGCDLAAAWQTISEIGARHFAGTGN